MKIPLHTLFNKVSRSIFDTAPKETRFFVIKDDKDIKVRVRGTEDNGLIVERLKDNDWKGDASVLNLIADGCSMSEVSKF